MDTGLVLQNILEMNELTWWIVSAETGKAVPRSDVRTATDPSRPNLRADAALFDGELGEMKSQDLEDDVDPFCLLLLIL